MGVQGLWELLAPVGRRVSVETLSGKKLAIDASIWMVQFMKAMRDERGEMIRNAHLLGFFRRICKLLFLRTKPVFVFDGGTPALKRRTVAARRRHRENARAKIRKTAEKLLLNHLKSKRLEELSEEIKRSKPDVKVDLKCEKVISQDLNKAIDQETLDEMLVASIAAEEEQKFISNIPDLTENVCYEEKDEDDEEKDIIFTVNSGSIDPEVLASLPPSMQLDLLHQMRENLMADNRQKYQKIKKVPAKFSELQIESYLKTIAFRREIVEVQKSASGRGVGGLQTSRIASDANREYIFSSSFTGDKQMLASASDEKIGASVSQETKREISSNAFKEKFFMSSSKIADNNSNGVISDTSRDERGRVGEHGIHMTRDLQRNLDLMKKYEKALLKCHSQIDHSSDSISLISEKNSHFDSVSIGDEEMHIDIRRNASIGDEQMHEEIRQNGEKSAKCLVNEAAIEISFLEDEIGSKTMVDNLFMNLVSENLSIELISERKEMDFNDSESDCIWEDGMLGEQSLSINDNHHEIQSPVIKSCGDEEKDEDMQEKGVYFVSCLEESKKQVSVGFRQEETELKDAIRSLGDIKSKDGKTMSADDQKPLTSVKDDVNIKFPVIKSNGGEEKNEKGTCFVSRLEEIKKQVSVGFRQEETELKEAMRRSLEDMKSKDGKTMAVDDKKSLTSVKDDANIIFPVIESNDGEEKDDYMWEKGAHSASRFEESKKEIFVGFQQEETEMKEVIRRSREEIKSEDGKAMTADDQKILTSVKNDVNIKFPLEMTQLHHPVIDLCTKIEEQNSSVSNRVVALSNDTLLEKHSMDQPSQEQTFSKVMVDEDMIGFLPENYFIAAQPAPSIGLSRTSAMGKLPVINDEMQEFFGKDADKDSAEGLSCSSQALIQDEDYITVSERNLHTEISRLNEESTNLGIEQRKLERNAESVSNEMFAECQELLQMFGLPYIIAPMEAEAQCAFMEMTNFVDGIVTDDSDVFLFGARNVYKNIFDDRKYVETYFMKDIEKELGLSRDNLIHMALLLGSDYTEGVSGIGIVNAIEVINAFPEKEGLQNFKEWVESPDPNIFGSDVFRHVTINGDTKDNMNAKESAIKGEESLESTISNAKTKDIFMEKHRNVSKNWHFPPSFPSESVISAYTLPQIDSSTEPFSWGKPDLPLLRKICWEKFGWPNQKADELLLPVLKEYNKHETQLRMEAFYSFNERFAKIRSQRIKKAVKGIAGNSSCAITEIDADDSTAVEIKSSKEIKKKDARQHVANGRAKGNGKARGKRKEAEQCLNENSSNFLEDEIRSNDEAYVSGMATEAVIVPHIRKSGRRRKEVNYAEDNKEICESHDFDKASDKVEFGLNKAHLEPKTFREDEDKFDENGAPGDCIHSGGGFCTEEGFQVEKQNYSGGDKCNYLIFEGEICNCPKDMEEDAKVDGAALNMLSAMPSLKRRRRK